MQHTFTHWTFKRSFSFRTTFSFSDLCYERYVSRGQCVHLVVKATDIATYFRTLVTGNDNMILPHKQVGVQTLMGLLLILDVLGDAFASQKLNQPSPDTFQRVVTSMRPHKTFLENEKNYDKARSCEKLHKEALFTIGQKQH